MIVLTLESWLPGTTRAVLSPYARQRQTVITGTIKTQFDQIWNAFWSGGISNPMEVIEQMTYLLFIKRLDELQTVKEKKANRTKARSEEHTSELQSLMRNSYAVFCLKKKQNYKKKKT